MEKENFEEIARACATFSARVSRAFLGYEEAIKGEKEAHGMLCDDLNLLRGELVDTKKVLEATKADSESLSKQFTSAQGLVKENEDMAERLFLENSKLHSEVKRLQDEVNSLKEDRDLDVGTSESRHISAMERARDEGRQEIREVGRIKLQQARACIEGIKAAFKATVKHKQTESVAISLRHLLKGESTLDKETVESYEAESERLKSLAEEVRVEELDPAFFSL